MEGASKANGRRTTVEEVFRDFRARRASMVKALTTDAKKFFEQCDPEKENLCLYGFPNETWEVNLPGEEVPPELPEPSLGINFARDGMDEKDWIALVAVHSDAWLMSVAFFFASRFGFDKDERRRLFTMINGMPTICEVVTGTVKKQPKEKIPNNKSTSKAGSKPPRKSELQSKMAAPPLKEEEDSEGGEEDDDEEETGKTLCGECGGYDTDKFWICCDICEVWFHGRCVNITPARAEHIKQYKCPACSGNKRGRA